MESIVDFEYDYISTDTESIVGFLYDYISTDTESGVDFQYDNISSDMLDMLCAKSMTIVVLVVLAQRMHIYS